MSIRPNANDKNAALSHTVFERFHSTGLLSSTPKFTQPNAQCNDEVMLTIFAREQKHYTNYTLNAVSTRLPTMKTNTHTTGI